MVKGRLDTILDVAGWSRCETVLGVRVRHGSLLAAVLAVSFHVDTIHVIREGGGGEMMMMMMMRIMLLFGMMDGWMDGECKIR